ncbi:MAG TPA: hypothetical protein VMT03_00545 [Polyangia bacterium]|nr:hypothetical protein [Polyangia bacterium]
MTPDSSTRPFLCWAAQTILVRGAGTFATLVAIALLAASLAGCGADFDPPTRLSKLRLLALQAAPVNPAAGETTTITPLVYSPSDAALEFAWSWCPVLGQANDGYVCPISHDDASAMLAAAGVTSSLPDFDLGAGPTASFTNPFPPDALAALCGAGFDGQPVDCKNGFPIRLSVRVTQGTAVQLGTTVIGLPIAAGAPSNANPTPGGLTIDLPSGTQALDDAGGVQVPRVQESLLHVAVDDGQAETYLGPGLDGGAATLRETLLFSWFSELGDFDNRRTLFIDGSNSLADASADKWTPPATRVDDHPTSRLIVVVRDDRGGVGWTTATAALEPTP